MALLKDDRKNLFINGGMDHWQRRTQIQNGTPNAATLLGSAQYNSVDRFQVEWSATVDGQIALERINYDLPSNEPNIQYCLQARGNSTASSNFRVVQKIESAITKGVANKEVTLSFWYKFDAATIDTSSADSFLRLSHAGGVDNWGVLETEIERIPVDGNFVFDGTWRKFSRTYSIPAGGANGLELDFRIALGASGVPTFRVTGFMLVEGSIAPAIFTHRQKDVGDELKLCYRYYWKPTYRSMFGAGVWNATGAAEASVTFPVIMRAIPTVNIIDPNALIISRRGTSNASMGGTNSIEAPGPGGVILNYDTVTGLSNAGDGATVFNNTDDAIEFIAEIV